MTASKRRLKRRNRTEDWKALPWKQFQRNLFRLQRRIYQASRRGDFKQVRNLQRLLLRSFSALLKNSEAAAHIAACTS